MCALSPSLANASHCNKCKFVELVAMVLINTVNQKVSICVDTIETQQNVIEVNSERKGPIEFTLVQRKYCVNKGQLCNCCLSVVFLSIYKMAVAEINY